MKSNVNLNKIVFIPKLELSYLLLKDVQKTNPKRSSRIFSQMNYDEIFENGNTEEKEKTIV